MGKSENRRLTALVAVRFLPSERDVLKAAAAARGVSMCELIRQALRNELIDRSEKG